MTTPKFGAKRPERPSEGGILAVVDCQECALAVGEGDFRNLEQYMAFGSPALSTPDSGDVARGHAAVKFVQELGLPSTWSSKLHIG